MKQAIMPISGLSKHHRWLLSRMRTILLFLLLLSACSPASAPGTATGSLRVLATTSVLADLAQNVAGSRLAIESLIPAGIDPHAYQPAPRDAVRIENAQVLIVNGAGFEESLASILNAYEGTVITAAQGLTSRSQPEDPHFWLDPTLAARYVENIRDGLITADPPGQETYTQNAAAYLQELQDLDQWIETQVQTIPPERRKLVTNHESFGYFADRYGFTVIGTVLPGSSTGAAPSAQVMAELIDTIREQQVPAIFLETGAQPTLAEQISAETGAAVVTDLHTHSMGEPGSTAATYIEMMRDNTNKLVAALR